MELRGRIIQKAQELFHKYGIKRVTMDDIATQLGISKKTIYNSFKDKNELVDAVTEELIFENISNCDFIRSNAENALHETFLSMDTVQEMFQKIHPGFLLDLEKYHPESFLRVKKLKEEYLMKIVSESLVWGIKEGIYRDDIDIELLAHFRLESIFMLFNLDVFPESRQSLTRTQQELMMHFLYGVASLEGYKLIEKYKQERLKKQLQ